MMSLVLAASVIFFNGHIFTSNPSLPEAEALAVREGRIIAIGSNDEVLKLKGKQTRLVDLKGRFVTPGLIDAHLHFLSGSLNLIHLDLSGLSLEEVLERVKEEARKRKPGEWIVGRGWDQTLWKEKKFPDKKLLDKVAPRNPVYLTRVDGHTVWVNSMALKLAGITRDTPSPEGGEIVKDEKGEPTGILKEEAISLVKPPQPDRKEKIRALLKGISYALENGVTTLGDMSESDAPFLYRELELEGRFPLRVVYSPFMEFGLEKVLYLRKTLKEWDSSKIKFGFVKGFIDGTLGSKTAALKKPYRGTDFLGILVIEPDELFRQVLLYHRLGFQIAYHAIGDRAVALGLEAYRRAQIIHPRADARHRLEHIQVYDPGDLRLFAEYGIIPSVQPCHLLTDIRFVEDRLGKERAVHSYPWRTFLRLHLPLAFGTDWPVEPIDPRRNLYAATTRLGWNTRETISMQEAILAYTIYSAYSLRVEREVGSLEPGKWADFVVWEKDFRKITPKEVLKNRVIMTVVGGQVVYKGKD